MNITVFGSGYVGLVTGACMAETGNHVVCVDVDEEKIAMLNRGQIPIHEPGLHDIVHRNVEAGRLMFTTDVRQGVDHGLFQFVAVGTPPDQDGSADLKFVLTVARSIGEHMNEYKIVVDKSTVPVGTSALCGCRSSSGPPTRCARPSPKCWPNAAPPSNSTSCPTRNFSRKGPPSATS